MQLFYNQKLIAQLQITEVDMFNHTAQFKPGPDYALCAELLEQQADLHQRLETLDRDVELPLEQQIESELEHLQERLNQAGDFYLQTPEGLQKLSDFTLLSKTYCSFKFEY